MDYIGEEISSVLPIDCHPSDVLIRRVDRAQSFLEVRKTELEKIKENICKSLIDLNAEVYHDESEKVERRRIIDEKMVTISTLELKIRELELECRRINQERLVIAEAVQSEREKLCREVEDLLEFRRKMDERRFIREMVYDIALPNEMMNFKKIDDFFNVHQREIERLERIKIGQTPSQIDSMNKQIAELEIKFNQELIEMDFQCDENGRKFFYDQNGVKKYANEFRIFMDELGDYVLDEDGNKSYLREYAHDENGRYYLDDDGNRIYKATPYSPECMLSNGVLIRIKQKSEDVSPAADYEERRISECSLLAAKSEYLGFLIENYAKPLKLALVDVAWKHPRDSIEYLQKYLSNYERKEMQRFVNDGYFGDLEQKRRIYARYIFEAQVKEKRRLYCQKE